MADDEIIAKLEAGWTGVGDYAEFARAHAAATEQYGEAWIDERHAEWEAKRAAAS